MRLDDQSRAPTASINRSSPLLEGDDWLWLSFSLVLAVGLRANFVYYVNVDPTDGRLDDSVFYHSIASLLAKGAGYINPWLGVPDAPWPPAYPAALAALYKIFGEHVLLAKGLNIACAAVTVVLVYILARRIFDSRVAFLGALMLALFPGQIYFSTLVMTETMFAMVFLLILLLAQVWTVEQSHARWWQLAVLGLLVGLAALVRAEGLFLAGVLLLLWACTVRPWRGLLPYSGLLALGLVVALTPWTIRNAIQLDEFVPIRTNAGNTISAILDPGTGPAPAAFTDSQPVSESLKHYKSHPEDFPKLTWEKLRRLYQNDADAVRWIQAVHVPTPALWTFESQISQQEATRWTNLANGYFFTVGAVALAGLAYCLIRRNRASLVLVLAILGWSIIFSVINPEPRYHFPLGPIISILAAAFVIAGWDAVRAKQRSGGVALRPAAKAEPVAADRPQPAPTGRQGVRPRTPTANRSVRRRAPPAP